MAENVGERDQRAGVNQRKSDNKILDLFSSNVIQNVIQEIKKDLSRKRRVQIKLLSQLKVFYNKIACMIEEDERLQWRVIENIKDWEELIVETTRLSITLSHPPGETHEVSNELYDLGAYMETIIVSAYTWCRNNDRIFGNFVVGLLNSLLDISVEYPKQWLYSVMISPIVLHIVNAFLYQDHQDLREKWATATTPLMRKLAKAIRECGDFSCQYYLMNVMSGWSQWSPLIRLKPFINETFGYVPATSRKQFYETENYGRIRNFLNAINTCARGPKIVIPVPIIYLFIGEEELKPPEHASNPEQDFWVDFSKGSGRIHVFYSFPDISSLLQLNIRHDQVDSVCLNWVQNDGESQSQSPSTCQTFEKNERILFFHIELNKDFESITSDVPSLVGKRYRSMYLVFQSGELAQRILTEMGYNIHTCGTRHCKRPKALRHLLSTKNKLSYSESWCPDSRVWGLDNTPSVHSNRSEKADSPFKFPVDEVSFTISTPGQSFIESLSPESSILHKKMTRSIPNLLKKVNSPTRRALQEICNNPKGKNTSKTQTTTKDLKQNDGEGAASYQSTLESSDTMQDLSEKSPPASFSPDRYPLDQNQRSSNISTGRPVRNLSQEYPKLFQEVEVVTNPLAAKKPKSPVRIRSTYTPSAKNVKKKIFKNVKSKRSPKYTPLNIIKKSFPIRKGTPISKGTPSKGYQTPSPATSKPSTPIMKETPIMLMARRTPKKSAKSTPTVFELPPTPGGYYIDSETQEFSQENHAPRSGQGTPQNIPHLQSGSPVETPGGEGFYVSMTTTTASSAREDSEILEYAQSCFDSPPPKDHNTTLTDREDPLPPEVRQKYGNVFVHSPFTPLKRIIERDKAAMAAAATESFPKPLISGENNLSESNSVVRCSSPNPHAWFQPASPSVSEICTPFEDVLNLTNSTASPPFSQLPETMDESLNQDIDGGSDKSLFSSISDEEPVSPALNQTKLNQKIDSDKKSLSPTSDEEFASSALNPIKLNQKNFSDKALSFISDEEPVSPAVNQIKLNENIVSVVNKSVSSTSDEESNSPGLNQLKSLSSPSDEEPVSPAVNQIKLNNNIVSVNNKSVSFTSDEEPNSPALNQVDFATHAKCKVVGLSTSTASGRQTKQSSSSKLPSSSGPCYANAYYEEKKKWLDRSRHPDFDPYDPWTCSEMEKYKKKMFPKMRTYPGIKKSKVEHKITARKNKISRTEKKQDSDSESHLFNVFSEQVKERKRKRASSSSNPPQDRENKKVGRPRKYASFFSKRGQQ